MLKRKIGVEIEFLGPDIKYDDFEDNWTKIRREICRKLNKKGVEIQGRRLGWNLKADCSVEDFTNYDRPGFELTTPPMEAAKDLKKLKKALEVLNAMGCGVNDTCGLHVHVDTRGLTPYQIAAVVDRYNNFSEEIEEWIDPERFDNEFCLYSGDSEELAIKALLSKTRTKFKKMFLGEKYSKVNVSSFSEHGTIEFRQHHGTLDPDRIIAWAKFCANFVEQTVKDLKDFKPNRKFIREVKEYNDKLIKANPWRRFERDFVEIPYFLRHENVNLFPEWKGSSLKGLRGAARKHLQETTY